MKNDIYVVFYPDRNKSDDHTLEYGGKGATEPKRTRSLQHVVEYFYAFCILILARGCHCLVLSQEKDDGVSDGCLAPLMNEICCQGLRPERHLLRA